MEKNKKVCAEFRFYEKPSQEPVLALMGEGWNRDYGEGVNQLHFHNMAEIGYCYSGNGKVVLNKTSYDFEEGSFTFIPHNYLHTTESEGMSQWEFFYFDAEELISDAFENNPNKCRKILEGVNKNAFIFSVKEENFLGNLVLMIFDLVRHKGNYCKDTMQGALFTIIMQIARIEAAGLESLRTEGGSKIVSALEYISYHYQEDIRICDLADSCHLSETHFRRVFQTDMSMTPVEYINLIRVQAACDLMKKGESHMGDVAVKVGYQTMSTFNRNFKQILGISPYKWKKQIDSEQDELGYYHVRAKKGW